MTNVLISVIIPTYNRIAVLEKCLKSVQNQTIASETYEIIIVDDCSTDNTKDVCREYVRTNSNIVYLRNETNQGSATTRNNGIMAAKGQILLFLDNDLIIQPDFIEQHIRCHEANQFADIVVLSDICYAPEYLKTTNYGRFIQSRAIGYRKPDDSGKLDLNNIPGNYFAGGGSSCGREQVIKNGMFNTSLKKYGCEDELFGYHFVKNGGRIVYESRAKLIHDDPNIGPAFWKRKYIEMGRYSLNEIYESERDFFENSNYRYLIHPSLKSDSFRVIVLKLIVSIISKAIFRVPLEKFVFSTDTKSNWYVEPLYRYITIAWMKFGFSTQHPIEKVVY